MPDFDYFVVFAEMRTGSNFLEANLNAVEGLSCLGEAFNPHFIGFPNKDDCLGVTMAEREARPESLIERVRSAEGLAGFRYFHNHDPRIFDIAVPDPRCAKVVLTRNPVDSYVSWKIAAATGQWKLTNMKHHKAQTIEFDGPEFAEHVEGLQQFQVRLLNALQASGQTAFYVDYEDLQSVDAMNGLAAWLGVEGRLDKLDRSLKKQNPTPVSEKVSNFPEMQAELSRFDRFDLGRTPNFEPRRGAGIPTFVAGADMPLLFMPVRSGPEAQVREWMAEATGGLREDFRQGTLRTWMREAGTHRAFTVLRHPLARAHAAYCDHIEAQGPGTYPKIRDALAQRYDVPVSSPEDDDAAHAAGFLGFLKFLKGNLSGQSSIRVDGAWASQFEVVSGFARFRSPDRILREDGLEAGLRDLTAELGAPSDVSLGAPAGHLARLAVIYDDALEAAARAAYGRDYEAFGFQNWPGA